MRIDIIMPQLGESVVEGTITKWLVRAGDMVQRDQPVVEVATDKADSEVPSPKSGRIEQVFGAEGEVVKIGALLCVLETEPTKQAPAPSPTSNQAASQERTKTPAPVEHLHNGMSDDQTFAPRAAQKATTPLPSTAQAAPAPATETGPKSPPRSAFPDVVTSPAVRRLALERGVDLNQVQGHGGKGTHHGGRRAQGFRSCREGSASGPGGA